MKYVANGFSPKMLRRRPGGHLVKFRDISVDEFMKNRKDAVSIIGHHNLAENLGLPRNRFNVWLEGGDVVYVIQSSTGRGHSMDSFNPEVTRYQRIDIIY